MATQITTNAGAGYGSPYVDSLIQGNASWSIDEPINVGFWNDGYSPAYDSTFLGWSNSETDAFGLAMSNYSAVCNLTYNLVTPSESVSSSNSTDIIWHLGTPGNFGIPDSDILGSHEFPDNYNASQGWGNWIGGFFNASHSTWSELTPGSYGYITILHELGHGMGLAHSHNSSDPFPGVSSSSDTGDYGLNQGIFTTMTYVDGWTGEPSPNQDYGWQKTLMAFDIAALQAMYGANNDHQTGANTYTLSTSNGLGVGWECIWDAGGVDTISNAGSSQNSTINLIAASLDGSEGAGGYVSWVGGVSGGFTIANNVVIENAIGGNGDDTIVGNSANNNLQGGQGNDTFYIIGGTDVIDGGTGNDSLVIGGNFADVTMGVSDDGSVIFKGSGSGSATITNVEGFEFTDQTFDVAGLLSDADVRPLFASPELVGGEWVNSYILPDVFSSGNAGLDALYDYQFFGDTAGNILVASDKNDFINGFGGDDAINTGAGNDIVDGGLGSNFLTGGSGNDTFFSDGREAGNGAITWSTVTDFAAGANSVNIWGYIDGTSTYEWYADAGATGWTGATLHADLDGNGTIDTSMTFTGMNEDQLLLSTQSIGDLGYLLIG